MTNERKPLKGAVSSRLGRGWKAHTRKELALMGGLLPLLKKRTGGREIPGLKAYGK